MTLSPKVVDEKYMMAKHKRSKRNNQEREKPHVGRFKLRRRLHSWTSTTPIAIKQKRIAPRQFLRTRKNIYLTIYVECINKA